MRRGALAENPQAHAVRIDARRSSRARSLRHPTSRVSMRSRTAEQLQAPAIASGMPALSAQMPRRRKQPQRLRRWTVRMAGTGARATHRRLDDARTSFPGDGRTPAATPYTACAPSRARRCSMSCGDSAPAAPPCSPGCHIGSRAGASGTSQPCAARRSAPAPAEPVLPAARRAAREMLRIRSGRRQLQHARRGAAHGDA